MLCANQIPSQIEQVANGGMSTKEPLSLLDRFESPHTPLSHPGRLIPDKAGQALGLLSSIILILFSTMNHIWHQLPMSNAIATQFVRHDLPGLAAMRSQ